MASQISDLYSQFQVQATDWLLGHLPRILVILAIAFVFSKLVQLFIGQAIRQAVRGDKYLSAQAEEKRENTLTGIFSQVFRAGIWLLASLMVLSELGIDTGPLIASAGIVGVAFGFGGQYLIKDIISGFFIILENQYRIGDVLCVNETCGLVEQVNLRTTILRDLDGTVHHIPNGEISIASNLSKDFSQVNMNIGVAYEADIEAVITVINNVGETLAKDNVWKKDILEAPHFLRIDEFADSAVTVKILGKTKPMRQWDVAGELRKRLKLAFDKAGIGLPYPQRVVHVVQEKK